MLYGKPYKFWFQALIWDGLNFFHLHPTNKLVEEIDALHAIVTFFAGFLAVVSGQNFHIVVSDIQLKLLLVDFFHGLKYLFLVFIWIRAEAFQKARLIRSAADKKWPFVAVIEETG